MSALNPRGSRCVSVAANLHVVVVRGNATSFRGAGLIFRTVGAVTPQGTSPSSRIRVRCLTAYIAEVRSFPTSAEDIFLSREQHDYRGLKAAYQNSGGVPQCGSLPRRPLRGPVLLALFWTEVALFFRHLVHFKHSPMQKLNTTSTVIFSTFRASC